MPTETQNPEIYAVAEWADNEIVANQNQKGNWRDKNYSNDELLADLRQHTDKLEASIFNQDGKITEHLADCFCYLVFIAKNNVDL